MKKICLIFTLLTMFLCGCNIKTEETWFMDFDEKDKEFGQFQTGPRNDAKAYEAELDAIHALLENYVDFIMEDDAKALADTFSPRLIDYLGDVNGVGYQTAMEIAQERILSTFDKTDIKDLYDGWKRNIHVIEITRIRIFSQRAELKNAYLSCGVRILDAIEVEFKVTAGTDERKSKIRIVKNANGGWVADADFFF